jgi:TRAP-type C4-dicarboxylate transport system permease small subunit
MEDITKSGKLASTQFRIVRRVSSALVYVGGAVLAVMMFLTAADVIGRFLHHPIEGTYELVGLFLVLVLGAGVANAQLEKAYVSVSIVYDRFPQNVRAALDIVAYLVGAGIAGLLCWQVFELGWRYIVRATGKVTDTLSIPYAPFLIVLALGFAFLVFVCLLDIYSTIKKDTKSKK